MFIKLGFCVKFFLHFSTRLAVGSYDRIYIVEKQEADNEAKRKNERNDHQKG